MRIQNKYLRNRAFRIKSWKRIRAKSHPHETYMPYMFLGKWQWTAEEQVKSNFERITEQARAIDKGNHRSFWHAPKHYRKILNAERKAREKYAMDRIRQGDYDAEFPKWKRDADWLWF
jgi:hypothetical protein